MFAKFMHNRNRKKLKDEKYSYLFDAPVEGEYVCFDCETTGLDSKKDDIISIGAVKIKENKILASEKFERFVKPQKKLGAESIQIHQMRTCDLMYGEDIDVVIEDFLDFIGSRPLVGYYIEFDVTMVNKYIKPKLGIKLPNKQIEVSALYHNQKIQGIPQGNIDLRFNSIMEDLKLPFMGKHDALNDAIMTSMIYIKLSYSNRR